jgi:epoxide hydrolase-like predicted phosphatase
MKTYRAIIFDCGGVLFDFSPDKVFDHWAKVSGTDASVLSNRFIFGEEYNQFERGEIDASSFRKQILNMLDIDINDDNFDNGWNCLYGDIVPGIEQVLQHLTRHYRLVALTNTNEIHARKWRILCAPLVCFFEKVFSSHEIHARKPEPEAYETVLKYLSLEPEDVIFLDDNPEYVRAASCMNITSIRVISLEQMVGELNALGAKIK